MCSCLEISEDTSALTRNGAIASTLASYVQTHLVAAGHGPERRCWIVVTKEMNVLSMY